MSQTPGAAWDLKKLIIVNIYKMQKQVLDVGHTQIGTTEKDGTTFRVYYGNYLMPPVGPRKIHPILRGDIYEKMLDDFLNSEEGQKYVRPTKEEIDEASTKVAELEERAQQKIDMQLQAAKKAKEPEYTKEFISQIDDEPSNDAEKAEEPEEKPKKIKQKR